MALGVLGDRGQRSSLNDFLRRVTDATDLAIRSLSGSFEPDLGFRSKPRFHFTEMMTVGTPKLGTRLAGVTRGGRVSAAKKSAVEYLSRLLTTNSARVVNDFSEQVFESRWRIHVELREHLRTVVFSAEAALRHATEQRALGENEVARELRTYERLRADLRVWAAQPAD
jgi:hypothetical protein